MATQIIKVPDLGGADEVEVIEVCINVGDSVDVEQSLLVLESDKASMEVPSPVAGIVKSILVSNGDTVSDGSEIVELELESEAEPPAEENAEPELAKSTSESEPEQEATPAVDATGAKPSNAEPTVVPVLLPDIGADAAEVIELSVAVGDELAEGDTLIVLETDKASMEVPTPNAGTVKAVHIKEGDELATGALLVDLLTQGQTESAASASEPSASVSEVPVPKATPAPAPVENVKAEPVSNVVSKTESGADSNVLSNVYAGPAVRKLAREFGVNLGLVSGSGPKGRILKEDLQSFVKQSIETGSSAASNVAQGMNGIAPIPEIDFAQFGPIESEPMTRLHKLTAANMTRSWLNVPHVTQYDDADISDLEDFRASLKPEMERRGTKLSPVPFLFKAVAVALLRHPKFLSSLHADGETIVYKQYCHIGMAVDTPAGLVVPVIRDADKKSVWEIGVEILDLADKAKNRKLKASDMQGGCFTISSLGNIGGQGFTPIINAPEVGILGVSRMTVKPVYRGDELLPRKMLPLSLSYDHRAVNGGDAGRFMTELCQLLSDIRLQLL
ncbi:MAG: dihydrolipoyllysine-residue acetyltransferase [Pseudomonadales bacterium]